MMMMMMMVVGGCGGGGGDLAVTMMMKMFTSDSSVNSNPSSRVPPRLSYKSKLCGKITRIMTRAGLIMIRSGGGCH